VFFSVEGFSDPRMDALIDLDTFVTSSGEDGSRISFGVVVSVSSRRIFSNVVTSVQD